MYAPQYALPPSTTAKFFSYNDIIARSPMNEARGVGEKSENKLFQITEAARACGLSRSTLMRMEEKGLLTPAHVAPESGRRYCPRIVLPPRAKKKADAMRPPQVRRKNRTHKGRNSGKPLRVSHL